MFIWAQDCASLLSTLLPLTSPFPSAVSKFCLLHGITLMAQPSGLSPLSPRLLLGLYLWLVVYSLFHVCALYPQKSFKFYRACSLNPTILLRVSPQNISTESHWSSIISPGEVFLKSPKDDGASTKERIKKMWSVYTMEYYSAIKKKEKLGHL